MRDGDSLNIVCTSSNGTGLKLLQITFLCSASFPTWRTAFIKLERSPTHRTLHKTFGARHPSSVTPLTGRASFPPGEAKGPLRICPRFLKTVGAYRNPSAAAAAAQLCMKRLYAVKDGYTR